MGTPPLSLGTVQERTIRVGPEGIAVKFLGAPGALSSDSTGLRRCMGHSGWVSYASGIDRRDAVIVRRACVNYPIYKGCTSPQSIRYEFPPRSLTIKRSPNAVARNGRSTIAIGSRPSKSDLIAPGGRYS